MRIHTNVLSSSDIYTATSGLPGVYAEAMGHGSRTHSRAFEIQLEGNGYRRNSGTHGASEEIGATWDEWGVFLSRLFEIDPEALVGTPKYPVYKSGADFHFQTGTRFAELTMPDDTHKRHNWKWGGGNAECSKCSATMRRA